MVRGSSPTPRGDTCAGAFLLSLDYYMLKKPPKRTRITCRDHDLSLFLGFSSKQPGWRIYSKIICGVLEQAVVDVYW